MTTKKLVHSTCIVSALICMLAWPMRVSAATIQLSVPAGTTNSLDAALAAQAPSYNDADGGVSLGANDIEVSGPGVLSFSKGLGQWTGNLTVKAGGIVRAVIGNTAVLGSASTGAVFVEAGGTVRSDDSANAGNGKAIARAINIVGTGTPNEKGAIVIYPGSGSLRSCVPDKVILTGDATITFCNAVGVLQQQFVSESKTFDLAGHTLTLSGAGIPSSPTETWKFPRFFFSGTYVLRPGHIIADRVIVECRSLERFAGDQSNTLTFTNGAEISLDGISGGMTTWTMKFDSSASQVLKVEPRSRTIDSLRAVHLGPVELGRSLIYNETVKPYANDIAAATNAFGFSGAVSGTGGLSVSSPRSRDKNYFTLGSADNSFTGGCAATNFTLLAKAPTAIPAGDHAGALTLRDSDVLLDYQLAGAADFAFPRVFFHGSGKIGGDRHIVNGSYGSLVKTGAGTLELKTTGSIGLLSLGEGTVTFKSGRSSFPGMQVGSGGRISDFYKNPFTWTEVDSKFSSEIPVRDFARQVLYTNDVTLAFPDIFYTPHGADTVKPASDNADFDSWNGWADPQTSGWYGKFQARIITGAGYLVNTSSVAKTIRVICTLNAYGYFKFGGEEFFQPSSGDIPRYHPGTVRDRTKGYDSWSYEPVTPKDPLSNFTVTLQPGMTRVEVRVWDRLGTKDSKSRLCYGNICTNGLANWRDDRGLMWTENLDSVDMNDYHMFADEGDGRFITTVVDVAEAASHVNVQIGTLAGSGGEVVLDGISAGVAALSGKPIVSNGTAALTGAWTLTATDVMSGTPLTSVDLTACTQIAMTAEEVSRIVRANEGTTDYVLARNVASAVPVCAELAAKGWKTVCDSNGDLLLRYSPAGLLVVFH